MTRKRSKQPSHSEFKWETCKHVQEIGQYIVYVDPSCQGIVNRPRGTLMVAKFRCVECPFYERRES